MAIQAVVFVTQDVWIVNWEVEGDPGKERVHGTVGVLQWPEL